MSQLPRYESYKDSGVQWLGEIPSHWVRTNVKYYYDVQLGKMLQPEAKSVDDINIKYLKAQHVQWEKIDSENMPEMWCSSKELSKYMVSNGDLLICEGGEVGRCGILANLEELAIIQNALHRVRNTARADVRYLNYFIQHTAQSDWFSILCNKATIAHFTSEKLLALPTLIPPLDEQKIIADFLDKRLAQVDALISKQETLLEKLAEQRVALISHAVTKGLNPDVEMKESGISWLGKVPTSWYLAKFKYVADISYGVGGEIDRSLVEGINLISLPNVKISGVLDVSEHPYCDEVDDQSVYLKKGDILFNWRNGSSDHLGKTVYFDLDGDWTHVSFLLKLRFNSEKFNSQFFNYLLSGYRYTKFFTSSKAGVNNTFNLNELSNLIAIVPPFDEQTKIVNLLNTEIAKIEKIEFTYKKSLEKLKEYRSTLITQVVTGKIDVRNLKVN